MAKSSSPSSSFARRKARLPVPSEIINGRGKRRLPISMILLFASLAIGAVIIWWSGFYAKTKNIAINLHTVSKTPTDKLQMTGARYSGKTASGLKFSLEADKVVELSDQTDLIRLFNPDGWIESETDGITTLLSEEALYNAQATILNLTGNVYIHQKQQNMTLKSQQMTALMNSGDLKTDTPISLTGPTIQLTAQGMESQNWGEIILFKGRTQVRLKQNQPDEEVRKQ